MTGDQRITGRLVSSWSVTTPAAPGWAQHARHQEDAPGDKVERDDMPSGGGWQPPVWDTMPGTAVMTGHSLDDGLGSHRRVRSHDGDEGRGAASPRVELDNTDKLLGGPKGTAPVLGAGGAANGGLRPEGTAPWMNQAYTRRRADGGTVVRQGGYRLGYVYAPEAERHRQGLHMNRPTLRGVREFNPTKGKDTSLRTSGVNRPVQRQPIAPASAGAPPTDAPATYSTTVIGSGFAL